MGFLDNLFPKRSRDTVVLQPKKPQKPPARQTVMVLLRDETAIANGQNPL
jgi:hypothetical protein